MSDGCQCLEKTSLSRVQGLLHERFVDTATGEAYHVVYAIHEAWMSFETFRVENDNEWFRELSGFLRFDGCIHFKTDDDDDDGAMAHYCDHNYKSFGFSLDCVYSIGRSRKVLR